MGTVPADTALETAAGNQRSFSLIGMLKRGWRSRASIITVSTIAALLFGWFGRENSNLSASDGLGYYLGIIGGSAMLLLLFYPLRKKLNFMRNWGPVPAWFQTHMFIGIFAPVLILFHSGFGTGSLNSNMALFSMLAVAISGLIGRFFYRKIHHGMSGAKSTLKELREDLQITKGKLSHQFTLSPAVVKRLSSYQKSVLKTRSFPVALCLLPLLSLRSLYTYLLIAHNLRSGLRKQARRNNWSRAMRRTLLKDASKMMRTYIGAVRRAGEFQFYEQVFALWHILHVPLFFLLVITGIVHVFAVHLY